MGLAEERAYYVSLLGWAADDTSYSLAELQALATDRIPNNETNKYLPNVYSPITVQVLQRKNTVDISNNKIFSYYTSRKDITVDNTGGPVKVDWPVKITLSSSNFDFTVCATDGSDLQFKSSDGAGVLSHWIQSWDFINQLATVWVRVPLIAANGSTTIRLYYGSHNKYLTKSDIRSVFPVGIDFSDTQYSVPDLSNQTIIATQSNFSGATTGPHTLSLVDFGSDNNSPNGYRYWGYVGVQNNSGENVWIGYSHDALTWTWNPTGLFGSSGYRWPTVLRADDGTFHMIVSTAAATRLDRYTSSDGLTWTLATTGVVSPSTNNYKAGNPFLFRDPVSSDYFLYYFWQAQSAGTAIRNEIRYRRASTISDLDTAADIRVLESNMTVAAPSVCYLLDGTYILSIEDADNTGNFWRTPLFTGPTPAGPWTSATNAMVLNNNEACGRFYVLNNSQLIFYSSQQNSSVWDLRVRTGLPYLKTTEARPWQSNYPFQSNAQDIIPSIILDGTSKVMQIIGLSGVTGHQAVFVEKQHPSDFEMVASVKRVTASTIYVRVACNYAGAGYRHWFGTSQAQIGKTAGFMNGPVAILTNTHGLSFPTTYTELKVQRLGTTHSLFIGGSLAATTTDATYSGPGYIAIEEPLNRSTNWDFIFVRPYDGTDPVVTVGSEVKI